MGEINKWPQDIMVEINILFIGWEGGGQRIRSLRKRRGSALGPVLKSGVLHFPRIKGAVT